MYAYVKLVLYGSRVSVCVSVRLLIAVVKG